MRNRSSILRRCASRAAAVLGILSISIGAASKSCRLIQDGIENRDDLSFAVSLTVQDLGGQIKDAFERSEPIQLVMTVRNELDTSAIIEFPTMRTSDFVVLRADAADVVWQWSDDQPAFQPTPTQLQFEAGETKTFTAIWNQTNENGLQVRVGTYQARGVLVFSGFDADPLQENPQASALVTFTIN